MNPAEALGAIEALEKFGIDLGLERVAACLDALGTPQNEYPTLHVGGTNGKGSTCALLSSVLTATGLVTGMYTSPPLERFGERIRVGGRDLPDAAVPALFEAVLGAERAHPEAAGMTQFEVITAMAFLHFARVGVDAAVVEVGLGGRLDSTNVITPAVAAITNVALEHAQHLGPTVEAIAAEKAGIVKPGVPVVTAAEGVALAVLDEHARRSGSPVYALGRDVSVENQGAGRFRYEGRRWQLPELRMSLLGGHQARNLGVALAALEVLEEQGWSLPEPQLRQGIEDARWAGRLELLGNGPRVVLDGAHNPHAASVLAQALRSDLQYDRLWLVLGILGDKDARSVLADLLPLAHRSVLTRSASVRALQPAELEEVAREFAAGSFCSAGDVVSALDLALGQALPGDLICVTGSLTTVGEARTHLRSLGWLS